MSKFYFSLQAEQQFQELKKTGNFEQLLQFTEVLVEQTKRREPTLDDYIRSGNLAKIQELFCEKGENAVNMADSMGYTPLRYAIDRENIGQIVEFISLGADLEIDKTHAESTPEQNPMRYSYNALQHAATHRKLNAGKAVIDAVMSSGNEKNKRLVRAEMINEGCDVLESDDWAQKVAHRIEQANRKWLEALEEARASVKTAQSATVEKVARQQENGLSSQ